MILDLLLKSSYMRRRKLLACLFLSCFFVSSHYLAAQPMSGTYTIGSGGNYSNFSAAVGALQSNGVNGAVTFQVNSGVFNERITIPQINGASAVNTITFQGNGVNSTTLRYSGSNPGDWATVALDGADHIRFTDMSIDALGNSYSVGVLMGGQSDSNHFINLRIRMDSNSTSPNIGGIVLSSNLFAFAAGSNSKGMQVDHVDFIGGYYAIRMDGIIPNNTFPEFVEIGHCSFHKQEKSAINALFISKIHIHHNKVSAMRSSNADAMYFINCSNFTMNDNTVVSPYSCITLLNFNMPGATDYDPNYRSQVSNNLLAGYNFFALFTSSIRNIGIYHNSIRSSFFGSALLENGSGLSVINNHFQNDLTSGDGYAVLVGSSTTFDSLDYNNYFTANTAVLIQKGNDNYSTLQSWQTAFPNYDMNSFNQDPNFLSATDLHLDQSKDNLRGLDIGITTDVDGDGRCSFAPTLGADESEFAHPTPTAGIAVTDSIFVNSPVTFFSTYNPIGNEQLEYIWYVNNGEVARTRDLYTLLSLPNSYTISLDIRNCSGSNSNSITRQVITPTSVPETDFVASRLSVFQFEAVELFDKSLHGPTSWEWSTNRPNDVLFENELAARTKLSFFVTGLYDICLKTENHLGQGNMVCKQAYISVEDNQSMCTSSGSQLPKGRISDDGGDQTGYQPNKNCGFLINPPCTESLVLKFSVFNLKDHNDSLRVYDGSDNTGTLLGSFSASSSLPGGSTGLLASSGKIYLEWKTDANGQSEGFEAVWEAVPDLSQPTPVAAFSYADTVFTGQEIGFQSTNTDASYTYEWDFDVPNQTAGLDGGNGENDRYSWNAPGSYPVKLKVSNCSGVDSVTQNVDVINPSTLPVVGFYADKNKVAVRGTVLLTDTSRQGGYAWKWEISPSTGVVMPNAGESKDIRVLFNTPGTYDVKLKVTNALGSDSLVKTSYIEVVDYCHPIVGSQSSDIGISRVKVGNMDNPSSIGTSKYTSYINTIPAEVVYTHHEFDITLERNSTFDEMNRKVWIDWNHDGDFDDADELVAYETAAKTLSYTTTVSVPSFATKGYTLMRVGAAYLSEKNSPCGINSTGEFEDYLLEVTDPLPVAPTLSLQGNNPDTVIVAGSYSDPGATAVNQFGTDISLQILTGHNLNLSVLGTYYYGYSVTDAWGNKDSVTRTVVVVDRTAPVITFIGKDTIDVEVFGFLNDPGITVTDNYYAGVSDIQTDSSNILTGEPGLYTLIYTATDSSGNTAVRERIVRVWDKTLPVITLIGKDTLVVDVYDSYTEQGVSVSDNYCQGFLNWNVDISPNTSVIGDYTLTYTATDCNGNEATPVTRLVQVRDRQAPVLELIGFPNASTVRWQPYTDAGVRISDNYYDSATLSGLLDITDDIDPNWPGTYNICYQVTDPSGNRSNKVCRTVVVTENLTGVEEAENHSITLYPNPNTGNFHIDLGSEPESAVQVVVRDMQGKAVYSSRFVEQKHNFRLTLAPGVYQVSILQDGKVTILRTQIVR